MIIRVKTWVRNIVVGIIFIGIITGIVILIISNRVKIDTNLYDVNFNRVSFINLQGWDIEETPFSEQEITIPEKFNSVYKNYNNIQQKQGWNLADYKGQKATEYIYKINNYNGGEENTYARVIIMDNRIIGGDVFKMEQNGFIKPLK
jgi:NhaP-type Na+/H+ and K+/H+ antiporter